MQQQKTPGTRYRKAMDEFQRDKFFRVLSCAICGLLLSHYLAMPSTILIGLYPALFAQTMERFSFVRLFKLCASLLLGTLAGTVVMEAFPGAPCLSILMTSGIFFATLKLFAGSVAVGYALNFIFLYIFASVSAPYRTASMEQAITEYFLIQAILIYFIVWGSFAFFPAVKPQLRHHVFSPPPHPVSNLELALYALLSLTIWLVFQFFEWKYTLFAFMAFLSALRVFEPEKLAANIREDIIAHVTGCSLTALFSLFLFSLNGNFFIFSGGAVVLVTPFVYRAVYPASPRTAYRSNALVGGLLVPMIFFLGIDHAAVYECKLRASLIVALLLLLYVFSRLILHCRETVNAMFRTVNYLKTGE